MAKQYDTDTEVMRIIAAFFVVMIHASGLGSFSAVVYNSVARFSVPVFVIISGYYLLTCPPKGTALGKKGLRLFLLMLLWSAVYYGYGLYSGSLTFTGARGLFTPLLYIFCEHAGRRVFLYALTLSFLMGSVVVILLRSGCFPLLTVIVDRAKLPCTLGFLFLFLLGGYLRRYGIPSAVHRRVLYLLGLAGVAVTVLCTWTLPAWGLPQDLLLSFFAPNVLVASAAFFVFVQQAVRHAHPQAPRVQAILHEMAGCTLGIYLLHPLLLSVLSSTVEPSLLSVSPSLWILQRTVLAYLLAVLLVFVVRRIPGLRRMV